MISYLSKTEAISSVTNQAGRKLRKLSSVGFKPIVKVLSALGEQLVMAVNRIVGIQFPLKILGVVEILV